MNSLAPSAVILSTVLLGYAPDLRAQCQCDLEIDASVSTLGPGDVAPGTVVCMTAGSRGGLLVQNVEGTEQDPIVIQNCGGLVDMSDRLRVYGSSHLRITGSGTEGLFWGIRIAAPTQPQAIDLSALSTHVEVDHVEITASAFAGVMAKTDSADLSFVQHGPNLHDNYIHGVDGEGIYIGYSFYGETTGHSIVDAIVRDNIIIDTGWDGIQVGSADGGTEIVDNYVESTGILTSEFVHQNGVQMGGGTRGRFEGNVVVRPKAHGLIMLGLGDTVVANNIVIEPGADGVWFSPRHFDRAGEHPVGVVANNTIFGAGDAGVQFHSSTVTTDNQLTNNLIIGAAVAPVDVHGSLEVTEETGLYVDTAAEAGLSSPITYDDLQQLDVRDRRQAVIEAFSLAAGSPALDAGTDLGSYDVERDIKGDLRSDGAYDIGAWEHVPLGDGGGGGATPGAGGGDGGTAAAAGGAGASAGAPAAKPPSAPGGCSCRTSGRGASHQGLFALVAIGFAGCARRRARPQRARTAA